MSGSCVVLREIVKVFDKQCDQDKLLAIEFGQYGLCWAEIFLSGLISSVEGLHQSFCSRPHKLASWQVAGQNYSARLFHSRTVDQGEPRCPRDPITLDVPNFEGKLSLSSTLNVLRQQKYLLHVLLADFCHVSS